MKIQKVKVFGRRSKKQLLISNRALRSWLMESERANVTLMEAVNWNESHTNHLKQRILELEEDIMFWKNTFNYVLSVYTKSKPRVGFVRRAVKKVLSHF